MNLCLSGDICAEEAVESATFPGKFRFCQKHQEGLDRIREMHSRGTFQTKRENYGGDERYCDTPGCYERPVYGGDFCYDCNGDD